MGTTFQLGPGLRYVLDLEARALCAAGDRIALGARALDVLITLAEAGGELVTKERLLQRCWPGLMVEEANIHVQVAALRKALGTDAIATVPGLGYRFAWPVQGAAASRLHNLPEPRTQFIGREALLVEAGARLQNTRLLTLIGIGGTGKTRLALELARQVAHHHADGAWWVDLAPLDQGAQLSSVVAQALGVLPRRDQDLSMVLPDWIRERNLLLLLDNCEHLVEDCAHFADRMLAAAPQLKLLLTSREALGAPGESVLPVAPLELPLPHSAVEEIMASEAVRLFVDRASLAAPDLALSPGDAAAVAEICRRADGIPLALELAAAQLRVISPAQLRDLLQDHFRLVSSHRRALPRQLTMHAIIRWSYDQLREDEQALLMALAICSGGCDLQAAAALTSPEMEPSVLLSGLARLADLSLLTVRHGAGNARYFILETVRQFAFERLQERDGAPALRVRHLKHYLELAEACAEEFSCTGEGARPMERIDIERDNLLRAIDACFHDEVPDAVASGLRLVAGLRRYWTARGMANRGAEFSLTALDRAAALSSTATYRSLLGSTVYMLWWSGRLEEALTRALELQRLSELANDRDRLALAHLELGTIHRRLGREDEGQWHFQRARSVALEAGNQCLYGDALVRLGHSALFRGRYEEAQRLYEEAMPARRSSGHGWRIVGVLQYAGVAAVHMSDAARARVYLREASAVLKRIGSVQFDLFMLDFAIALAVLERHWALVARLGGVLQRLQPLKGPPLRLGEGGRRVEDLECARTALGAEAFDDAWRLGLATDLSHALTFIDGWLHGKEAPARLASGLPLEPG